MYKLSKDYSRAFVDLYDNKYLICFVDYEISSEDVHKKDICRCKLLSNDIIFSSRGHEYGSVDYINEMGSFLEEKGFIRECERLNAEFILF